jgi:hypothetical protein
MSAVIGCKTVSHVSGQQEHVFQGKAIHHISVCDEWYEAQRPRTRSKYIVYKLPYLRKVYKRRTCRHSMGNGQWTMMRSTYGDVIRSGQIHKKRRQMLFIDERSCCNTTYTSIGERSGNHIKHIQHNQCITQ